MSSVPSNTTPRGRTTTLYTYGADGLRRRMEADTQVVGGPGHPGHPSHSSSTATDEDTDEGTDEGTSYAYDGTMLVREGHAQTTDGASSLQPETVTATYLIGARGPEYRRDDTQTETDSQGRTVTKARWYVYDGLGSVVGEVDPLGNLTSSPNYDVYGAVRSNGGTASSKQGFVGSLGHVSDDTGLIYMRARYMDPLTGRFVSQDPAKSGSNWFVYCGDNPTSGVDADGKKPILLEALQAFLNNLTEFAQGVENLNKFYPLIVALVQIISDIQQGKPLNLAAYAFDAIAAGLSVLGGAIFSTLREEVDKMNWDIRTANTLKATINMISIGFNLELDITANTVDS